MKHTLPLVVLLSLLLSLFAGTSAHGQCAQRPLLCSAEAITTDAAIAPPAQLREGTVATVGQLIAGGRALRAQRWAHPSFRIRLGRSFCITVPKH